MWDVILIRDNALSIEMTATHSLRRQALIAFDRMHQSAAYIASVMLTAERQRRSNWLHNNSLSACHCPSPPLQLDGISELSGVFKTPAKKVVPPDT